MAWFTSSIRCCCRNNDQARAYNHKVRLRQRLNIVLLQWGVLLTVITGAVWLLALPGIRRNLVDERLLLAHSVAHGLDTSLSTAIQGLGRLAEDLPDATDEVAARLHAFRFQSPFSDAIYLLDAHGRLIAADPAGVEPLAASWLGYHEAVTPLVRKAGREEAPVLAAIQPFKRQGRDHYLVAEMSVRGSALTTFLQGLAPSSTMQVLVVDEHGVVVASQDPAQFLRVLPGADAFGDRIRANRPLVLDESAGTLSVMAPLRFAAWGVVIQQAEGSAFVSLNATSRALVVTGLALAVVGVLLVRTLTRSIVSPIRQLSRQADGMRGGDLSSVIAVSGDLEIEVLARTLDEARTRLSSTLDRLQAFNEQLESQVVARTRVIEQQHEQRRLLVRRMLGATEDERRRLARELHDEIAQMLTVIQMSLHQIAPATPQLQQANALLMKTQVEIHRIIHDLRPSLLDDLGLAAAMQSYADDHLGTHGLQVSLDIATGLQAGTEVETVIFRIYQELLTNILRHAGAEHVTVDLSRRNDRLVLVVEDDGRGFDPAAKAEGAGIIGMRERAALVNGTITFDSEASQGTHVIVEIPI
jgi:signal transduction histidine kinase